MAELLIIPTDRGSYSRGDVVVAMPDGHEWGQEEQPPKFYLVKVPGLDIAVARERARQWTYAVDWAVLSNDNNNYRLRLWSTSANASGLGRLTADKVQDWLDAHDATNVTVTDGAVEFDIYLPTPVDRESFKSAVKAALEAKLIKRRRYYLNTTAMNWLDGQGGIASVTAAQLNGYVIDRLSE